MAPAISKPYLNARQPLLDGRGQPVTSHSNCDSTRSIVSLVRRKPSSLDVCRLSSGCITHGRFLPKMMQVLHSHNIVEELVFAMRPHPLSSSSTATIFYDLTMIYRKSCLSEATVVTRTSYLPLIFCRSAQSYLSLRNLRTSLMTDLLREKIGSQ